MVKNPTSRVIGFDLARAVAIWGMVTVHCYEILAYHETRPAWLKWCLDLLDGRAAALFVILAGIGITLRAQKSSAAGENSDRWQATLVRRGVVLLVVGFLNLIIWEGDILRVYGVSLVLASRMLHVSDRQLLGVAGIFILGFIALMPVGDYGAEWNWETLEYSPLWTVRGTLRNLFFNGFRSVFPWTGLLLGGMWLGRQRWTDPRRCRRWLCLSAMLAVAAEGGSALLIALLERLPTGLSHAELVWLFGTVSMPPLPLFLLSAGSSAVAVLCASLLIAERFGGAVIVRALVACGQMAFTWYMGHILVFLVGFLALGLPGHVSLAGCCGLAAGFFTVICGISLAVRTRGRRGPLEAMLRWIAG